MAVAMDWVEVPRGAVLRGTPAEDLDEIVRRHRAYDLPRSYFAKETPRAEVAVAGFCISRTPVTTAQWNMFCEVAGWDPRHEDPRLPVEGVAWWQAAAFCEWVTQKNGVAVRLPEEVEWERAARGDDDREYPWGNSFERRRANLAELGIGHRLPVGSLPLGASTFGVLDLAGNVDEWTATEFEPYPGALTEVASAEDQAFDRHVTRGGSYIHCMDLARCARRHGIYEQGEGAGFRVVGPL